VEIEEAAEYIKAHVTKPVVAYIADVTAPKENAWIMRAQLFLVAKERLLKSLQRLRLRGLVRPSHRPVWELRLKNTFELNSSLLFVSGRRIPFSPAHKMLMSKKCFLNHFFFCVLL